MMRCTVCHDSRVELIDHALRSGTTLREVADRFPGISKDGAGRHKKHMDQRSALEMVQAPQAAESLPLSMERLEHRGMVVNPDGLLNEVEKIRRTGWHLLDRAEGAGEIKTAVGSLREIRGTAELSARLSGRLSVDSSGGMTVNINIGLAEPNAAGPVIDVDSVEID